MGKIVFIDVDGTLYSNDLKISEENHKLIKQAQNSGVPVVINTGRVGANAKLIAEEIDADKFSSFAIGNDGSEIWSFKENKWVYLQQIPTLIIKELNDWLKSYSSDLVLNFSCIEKIYVSELYQKWYSWFKDLKIDVEEISNIEQIQFPVSKIIIIIKKRWEEKEISLLIKKFADKFKDLEIIHYHGNVLSIGLRDVNKGTAAQWLCNYLKISINNALAIGDSFNDLSILKIVGYPAVMGNANVKVKDYGKFLVKDNNNSGVAEAINTFLTTK